jgi:TRAP-type uncharacterized transport system substrate-binding protein
MQRPPTPTLPKPAAQLAVALLWCWLVPAGAAASDVVIAGGEDGRTYHRYAINLGSLLPGFKASYRQTAGSGENLDLLADGIADVGFAQVDAFAARMRVEPERFGKVGIVGRLSDECVFIAYRKEGRVTSQADLQAEREGGKAKLSVGSPRGGMLATWSFMQELEPAFGATATNFTEGTLAINHLATGMLDAVGWVTDPANREHKLLLAVLANDELGILDIDDPDLVHSLPDGTRVYELKEVALTGGFRPRKITTLCTGSAIFSKPGIEPRLLQSVSDVLSLQRAAILSLD